MSGSGQILVVDDEDGIRQICERTLRHMGFCVQGVPDGQAAIEKLCSQDFDFVLTDLAMPKPIDGARLTEEIKQRWPATDVVIMTAYPTLETAIPTLKNGAYDYLIKPFGQELLQSVVTRCFERRRLAKELDREKMLRQELQAAYAELQKVERLKEAILSRVSHELRSPLCSGSMALATLATLSHNSQGAKSCAIIRSSFAQLQQSVENLLLFAEFAHTNVFLKKSSVDVRALIDGTVQLYKSFGDERQIRVEVKWEKQIKALSADAARLQIAFKHLFLNALQFNRKGGSVLIHGSGGAEDVRISFSDTGLGIPKEELSKVFDGFYQAAEYLTREVGGLGLGLAIVRRIAEAHGGSVCGESEEGRGSVFTIRLPTKERRGALGRDSKDA